MNEMNEYIYTTFIRPKMTAIKQDKRKTK
jgi:hypothetical protein